MRHGLACAGCARIRVQGRKDEQAWTLEKMQHRKGDVLAVHRLAHTQRTLSVVAVR